MWEEKNLKGKIFVLLVSTTLLIGIISGCVEEKKTTTPTNNAPVASFTYLVDHNTSTAGGTVSFTDASTDADGDTLTYSWDFGDDIGTSTEQNHSYIYAENESYTVTLTVNDSKTETTFSDTVIVGNIAPTASFIWTAVNLTVTFTDASSDPNEDELTYAWDFDENDVADDDTAGPVTYTFAAAGSYNVTLTVTDTWGLTDSYTELITVE